MTDDDDKLPPDRVRRSEGYVNWDAGVVDSSKLPSNPRWGRLLQALPKHPLLVIRGTRRAIKTRVLAPLGSIEGSRLLIAIAELHVASGGKLSSAPTPSLLGFDEHQIAAYVREHGVPAKLLEVP